MSFYPIPAAITVPQGFRAAGVFCDIKRLGTGKGSDKGPKRDLCLIVSDLPAAVAGLFTTNKVCAAPVKVSISRANGDYAQAVVANSGNANACTGLIGLRDAKDMTELAGKELGLSSRSILVCSTGRIGVPMPMDNVRAGIQACAKMLDYSPEHGHEAAEAILTSDTHAKEVAVELKLGKHKIRIAGICKGAGMIQPGMSCNAKRPAAIPLHATMLAFLTSDAAIEPRALKDALNEAVAHSFNRITVDGDMSTNDSVIILANGMARNPIITKSSRLMGNRLLFQKALNYVTLELAKMIVRDGEGVSRFVTVRVSGARSFADADAAARAVANSALVKTSWCGGDPNWGRILDALGYSNSHIVEEKIDVAYSKPGSTRMLFAVKKGQPTRTSFRTLCSLVAEKEFDLHINLNLGTSEAVIYTCDLTEAYVDFNKGDVSNPSALGG
jgi:glutamate N-acetyltransferase / amino-acid N-acetyltransferase